MTVDQLRAQNIPYRTDGSTKLAEHEAPAVRAMHGEQFDGLEVIVRQPNRSDPLHLVVSGGPLRDASGAVSGAAVVYHDLSPPPETDPNLSTPQQLHPLPQLH